MKIRAHHLRILGEIIENNGDLYHIDFGLSDEYKHVAPRLQQYFKEVYQTLIKNPSLEVSIVDSLDDICIKCPNSDGIKCMKYSGLDGVDNETLTELGFSYGEYSAKEVITRLDHSNLFILDFV